LRQRKPKKRWPAGTIELTIEEAAIQLGVDSTRLTYLVFRGGQMGLVRSPAVRVSQETGQRIEYFLADLEEVVAADAEQRLRSDDLWADAVKL
jgi:hypothetical protein